MSVPIPARVGMNGSLNVSACRAQISVCSLYSSIATAPACTAARNFGARPSPSKLTSPEMTLRTQPPATSQSTASPWTIATSVRSRTPRRSRARTNAIGVEFIDSPPTATVAPSGTRAAASSRLRSFTPGPLSTLPGVVPSVCRLVESNQTFGRIFVPLGDSTVIDVQHFDHIGIAVRDLRRAAELYGDLFGGELVRGGDDI